jgi:hypothetical protein
MDARVRSPGDRQPGRLLESKHQRKGVVEHPFNGA